MSVINTQNFGQFVSVSWTITHSFLVPERFPRLTNLGVRLRVGHQHSWFLSILTLFMDYYSRFWGPIAISMVVKPQGALTCRSSTLAVLADSGPFHGLLLTILGSRSDCEITCRSSTLAVLADSGLFHGLLLTVLGSQSEIHD